MRPSGPPLRGRDIHIKGVFWTLWYWRCRTSQLHWPVTSKARERPMGCKNLTGPSCQHLSCCQHYGLYPSDRPGSLPPFRPSSASIRWDHHIFYISVGLWTLLGFKTGGQCEGLYSVERASDSAPRFFYVCQLTEKTRLFIGSWRGGKGKSEAITVFILPL